MTDLRRVVPSMQDVARRAGVSLGTVSNTLNSPEKVREQTRQRVHSAIAELGFVRNDAARSLAAGTSTSIGLVLVDIGNSFFVDIARGAEALARQRGMNLLIANSDVDLEKQDTYIDVFAQARVAGVLLAPLDTPGAGELRPNLAGLPAVLVNYAATDAALPSVVADEELGGFLAAQHLIELGRRQLLFIGALENLHAVQQRLVGARRAAADRPDVTLQVLESKGLNVQHGRAAAESILARGTRVDGIVAASDLIAVGCIQVLERAEGYRVPHDVAVVGYDNNHFASESDIPVSTVGQPGEQMGREAARLLLDQVLGQPLDQRGPVVLAPHLIVRASTVGALETARP